MIVASNELKFPPVNLACLEHNAFWLASSIHDAAEEQSGYKQAVHSKEYWTKLSML